MCCSCWKDEFQIKNFLLDHPQPELFGQAQCGRCTIPYIVYRVIWAIFLFGVWIYDLTDESDAKYLIYFTNWTYMTLTLCSTLECICAIFHAIKTSRGNKKGLEHCYEGMPVLYKMTWVVYNIIVPTAPVVTIIYWGALYTPGTNVGLVNGVTHGINSVYVLTNLFITGIPTRLYHIWHCFIFVAVYIIFTGIYYAAGGTNSAGDPYVYSILDYGDNPALAIGLAFGLSLGALPLMVLFIFGLYKLKITMYGCCSCTPVIEPVDSDSGKETGHVNEGFEIA